MPKTLGANHLSTNKTYEIQRNNHFEVQIAGLDESLTFVVESFSLPNFSNAPIELAHGNTRVKVAGQTTFEDSELVVKDAIGADIEKIVNNWQKQVYDPATDKIGFAADYKKTATVYQFAPDGSSERSWTLSGVWPNAVAYGDMAYDGSDNKTITMTLSYDKAVRN
jgi:hypothetical protein